MRNFQLASTFYYGGCVGYNGHKCSLRDLQAQVKDGWEVYAIDVPLGSYAPPFRFFVGTTGSSYHPRAESEALSALIEYAVTYPKSRAARLLLDRITKKEYEADTGEWTTVHASTVGKRVWYFKESEEGPCGIGMVTDAETIAKLPGGVYEKFVTAIDTYASVDYAYDENSRREAGGYQIYGLIPGSTNCGVIAKSTEDGPVGVLNAWKAAAVKLGWTKRKHRKTVTCG